MNLILELLQDLTPSDRLFEVVERKGLGHPDSICDALAEALSSKLSQHYLKQFGKVLHYNVDKILLCGGSAQPEFGGGRLIDPIEVYFSGRAVLDYQGVRTPIEDLAIETARRWFAENFEEIKFDQMVKVICRIRPGSADLKDLFSRNASVPLANDTSIGVGFSPMTQLEHAVLSIEQKMNSKEFRAQHPEAGRDIKVMGVRTNSEIHLTIACAFISKHVSSLSHYMELKERMRIDLLAMSKELLKCNVYLDINSADRMSSGGIYLTVTGTSAEAGDDGEVGRGNRSNGLITPCRPMVMEAAAGKNSVTHPGRIYQLAAQTIAERLNARLPTSRAECFLVSKIGTPINEPQTVTVRIQSNVQLDSTATKKLVKNEVEMVLNALASH